MTFILIPGAGGDAAHWHRLVPLLEARGHEAVPVELPADDDTAGLAEYTAIVVDAIGDRRGVVVVAQSMGALTAPLVCEHADVALLVLVAPMIPAPGETGGEWWTASGQAAAQREQDLRDGRDPDGPFDPVALFLHDLPPDVLAEVLAAPPRDQSDRPFADPWPLRAWPDVPTRVVAGRHDRLLPLEFVRRLSRERLGVEPDVVDSGHVPALARPGELADLLVRYAVEVEAGGRSATSDQAALG
jgi:pimeloyl-ACP methyl ester carboxylesterase